MRIAYCEVRNLTCITLCVLTMRAMASAQGKPGVLSPLKVIELPFVPGERSVNELSIRDDGVVGSAEGPKLGHRFEYSNRENRLVMIGQSGPSWSPLGQQKSQVMARLFDPDLALRDDGHFFYFKKTGPNSHIARDLGRISGTRPFEKEGFQFTRVLIRDADSNVYTAGKDGFIFRFSPKTEKLEQLTARLPAVQGREPWASLDAAVLSVDGLIYGGTFDGYLFTFDPKTLEVVNFGKPLRQQRIQGLAFSKGKLYGVGGEDEGLPRAFAFDPKTRGFELGGTLKTTDGKIILDPVGAMVADQDGNIYLGTTGRLGNLYVWENKP